jgi:putative Ca2+/H+ antiporter (TMEM165/GDT1 family)
MWKSILTSFLLIFLAELGDKTQLSTMLLASKSSSVWPTFIGASFALLLSSFIAVLAGSLLNKYIPLSYIQFSSGLLFVVIGGMLLFGKM